MKTNIPFLITIDTEGDNLWGYTSGNITTTNAQYLKRFQSLCEKHTLKPTWLVNFEMAICDDFIQFGKEVIKNNTGEIGMHLHAWNSPPLVKLDENDKQNQSYLIEFPKEIMEDKIKYMTELLEDTFKVKMVSHRAGRWAFDETYAKLLIKYGYKIDCSVTPFVNWEDMKGGKINSKGSDYSDFMTNDYFIDEDNISKSGNSKLLEVPMSILKTFSYEYNNILKNMPNIIQKISNKLFPSVLWLRPNGKNLKEMKYILDNAIKNKLTYVEFMIHSSEFMPGGSPYFKTEKSIEKLYQDLEELMSYAKKLGFKCQTMKEFYDEINCD
jgi:hypothetical protein